MDLLINEKRYTVDANSNESLLNILREKLDLTGSKYGCGEGSCGACTVLINGKATRSCITMAGTVGEKKITTIEGLADEKNLHPVQNALLEADAFQCAYCAPGMVMSAVSLLKSNARPSEADIVRAMQGNICRCGTYPRIVKAIQNASNQ